ncbi:MAG: hypothetical protein ABIS06_03220 [Vicinamibacterales bacterium]
MRALPAVLLPLLLFVAACSEPPQKEIDRAQGGIDAARAAGAELYATEAFGAATAALQQSHDAVAQRDYRLALTRALDANDRAQEAARGAADGKAHARSEAERAINLAAAALLRLRATLGRESANLAAKDSAAAAATVHDAEAALQKARAALSVGDYITAREAVKGVDVTLNAQIQAVDAAAAARPARPPKRRR